MRASGTFDPKIQFIRAVREFITSEQLYSNNMGGFVRVCKELRNSNVLSDEEKRALDFYLQPYEAIIKLDKNKNDPSSDFLSQFDHVNQSQMVTLDKANEKNAFDLADALDAFDVIHDHMANHHGELAVISSVAAVEKGHLEVFFNRLKKKYANNESFNDIFNHFHDVDNSGDPIGSLTIQPIQRGARYALLAKDIGQVNKDEAAIKIIREKRGYNIDVKFKNLEKYSKAIVEHTNEFKRKLEYETSKYSFDNMMKKYNKKLAYVYSYDRFQEFEQKRENMLSILKNDIVLKSLDDIEKANKGNVKYIGAINRARTLINSKLTGNITSKELDKLLKSVTKHLRAQDKRQFLKALSNEYSHANGVFQYDAFKSALSDYEYARQLKHKHENEFKLSDYQLIALVEAEKLKMPPPSLSGLSPTWEKPKAKPKQSSQRPPVVLGRERVKGEASAKQAKLSTPPAPPSQPSSPSLSRKGAKPSQKQNMFDDLAKELQRRHKEAGDMNRLARKANPKGAKALSQETKNAFGINTTENSPKSNDSDGLKKRR